MWYNKDILIPIERRECMKIILQIGAVLAICLLGEGVSLLLPIPFPGSVISMILLFLLLLGRIVKVPQIQQTAEFLTGNMAFFFIPAGVGILENWELLAQNLAALAVIAVITTFLTFAATAYTVRAVMAWQERRRK